MDLEWTFTKPDFFTDDDMNIIEKTADAVVAYKEEYGDSGWRGNPLEDEHINDIEPFQNLEEWQLNIMREIIENDDIRIRIAPLMREGDAISGEYDNLCYFAPIVSALMREKDMEDKFISFDCLCNNLDSGQLIMIGKDGWIAVGTDEMAKNPVNAVANGILQVCGRDKAIYMLEQAENDLKLKVYHDPAARLY